MKNCIAVSPDESLLEDFSQFQIELSRASLQMKILKIDFSAFFFFLVCVFKEYSYSISHRKTCSGRLCLGSENGMWWGRGGNHCVGGIFVPESIRQRLI